jgi:hypothetical protein
MDFPVRFITVQDSTLEAPEVIFLDVNIGDDEIEITLDGQKWFFEGQPVIGHIVEQFDDLNEPDSRELYGFTGTVKSIKDENGKTVVVLSIKQMVQPL